MKLVDCNWCKSSETNLLLVKDGYSIVRCKNCGLSYVNPRDDDEEVFDLYSKSYYAIEESDSTDSVGYRNYAADRELHERYFKKKLDEIGEYKTKGKLLDVGCAFGYFLGVSQAKGFDVYGVDVSPYAVRQARSLIGRRRIVRGTVQDVSWKNGSFSVVIAFQTLEHSVDPVGDLRKMYELLEEGGVLVFVVPDLGSLKAKFMGKSWFGFKPREHLYYFEQDFVSDMIRDIGFKVEKLETDIPREYPLSYVFERTSYLFSSISFLVRRAQQMTDSFRLSERVVKIRLGDISCLAIKK